MAVSNAAAPNTVSEHHHSTPSWIPHVVAHACGRERVAVRVTRMTSGPGAAAPTKFRPTMTARSAGAITAACP